MAEFLPEKNTACDNLPYINIKYYYLNVIILDLICTKF